MEYVFFPFSSVFSNEKGILAHKHQPFSQFFLASSWKRAGMLPPAPAFIQRLPRAWGALGSAKEGMGSESSLGAGRAKHAGGSSGRFWDGWRGWIHPLCPLPSQGEHPWHCCKGTAGLQPCPSKPRAASQQAQCATPAIWAPRPSKPSAVSEQSWGCIPASPVLCPSKPLGLLHPRNPSALFH